MYILSHTVPSGCLKKKINYVCQKTLLQGSTQSGKDMLQRSRRMDLRKKMVVGTCLEVALSTKNKILLWLALANNALTQDNGLKRG